jgi:hypothetical protein
MSQSKSSFAWRAASALATTLIVIGVIWLGLDLGGRTGIDFEALRRGHTRRLEPMQVSGAPLRTAQGGVDRIYVLGTQAETQIPLRPRRGFSQNFKRLLHVDLWAIDADGAHVAWRKRLRTFAEGERSGLDLSAIDLLGADGEILWVMVRGPLGVSLVDGDIRIDGARIDAANPFMAGKRVDQTGYVAFGRDGLQLTLSDASQWRVGADLHTVPRSAPAREGGGIVAPSKSSTTSAFQVRGLPIGARWLGVLTDAEVDGLRTKHAAAAGHERSTPFDDYMDEQNIPQLLSAGPRPYRLWSARVTQVSAGPRDWPKELPNNWGTRPQFSDYAVLPEAPTFLQAGLLVEGSGGVHEQALWLREPDSVLVMHRDRVGDAGRVQISRVAGPGGRIVWLASLGLADVHAVMRGTRTLLVLGSEDVPARAGARDAQAVTHERVVAVDLASGAVTPLDLTDTSMHMEEVAETINRSP